MAKINLLPWREELREQRNTEYYAALGVVVAVAALIVYLVVSFYDDALRSQQNRNNFISREMRVLDEKIAEIQELPRTREQLIDRMELIQALQGNRPVIVRVFDDVARSVPDDLFFTSFDAKGNTVTIKGIAKSNNRVAALMRNFDRSPWFDEPELKKVQSTGKGTNEFEVSMVRVTPKTDDQESGGAR